MNKTITREIIELIADLDLQVNRDDVRMLEKYIESEYDFYIEIDGSEYRFIAESHIWDIYVDSIEELSRDCFLGSDIPWWIAIDWEETAENCLQADGYGHHFASYDGDEHECKIGVENYYYFRTN